MRIPDYNPPSTPPVSTSPISATPKAILVRLYPSRLYWYGVCAMHLIAVTALLYAGLPIIVKWAGLLSLITSNVYAYRQWKNEPVWRIQHRYDTWYLLDDNNAGHAHRLVEPTGYSIEGCHLWSLHFLVLRVQNHKGKTRFLPVVYDSCSKEQFRWLRVIARFYLHHPKDKRQK